MINTKPVRDRLPNYQLAVVQSRLRAIFLEKRLNGGIRKESRTGTNRWFPHSLIRESVANLLGLSYVSQDVRGDNTAP